MKNNLFKSFFSSGLQALAVQVLSALFFLLIPLYLPTESFGIIIGANAISVMITTFLSFGLEQIVTRRIASSDRSDWAAAAYLFHALTGSAVALIVLVLLRQFFAGNSSLYYLPWFFAAQAIMYSATPLKQYLNAKQVFTPYGIIAVSSNLFKILLGFVFLKFEILNIDTVYLILILSALIEFVSLYIYVVKKKKLSFVFKKIAYVKLVKEALPLYSTAIFDAILKRADAILLSILSTNIITGEYGFAYKAYEIATLPIFVIGPVILAKFARTATTGGFTPTKTGEVRQLFSLEIFLAMMVPLVLNLLWVPLLDSIYHGKYGSTNATEFLLLSICIPFQFTISLLWTLCFTHKMYKHVSLATIISAFTNLLLNVLLIPVLGGLGAAIAYVATCFIQTAIYYYKVSREIMTLPVISFFLFFLLAGISYFISQSLHIHVVLQIFVALIIYAALALLLRQISSKHYHILKLYLKK